jgi:hypothetical protein
MIDREEQAAADIPRERHDAVVGRHDHRANRCGDVDAAVTGAVRIIGRVEAAHDRTGDRPRPGNRRASTDRGPPHGSDNREH